MTNPELIEQLDKLFIKRLQPVVNGQLAIAARVTKLETDVANLKIVDVRHSERVRALSSSNHDLSDKLQAEALERKTSMQKLDSFATDGKRMVIGIVNLLALAGVVALELWLRRH